jgi:hypothetical protein
MDSEGGVTMEDIFKKIDALYETLDKDLIENSLAPMIEKTIKEEVYSLKNAGLRDDELLWASIAVATTHSLKASALIAAILVSIDHEKPFNPADFLHLVE